MTSSRKAIGVILYLDRHTGGRVCAESEIKRFLFPETLGKCRLLLGLSGPGPKALRLERQPPSNLHDALRSERRGNLPKRVIVNVGVRIGKLRVVERIEGL